jgi:hypothetical protein
MLYAKAAVLKKSAPLLALPIISPLHHGSTRQQKFLTGIRYALPNCAERVDTIKKSLTDTITTNLAVYLK